MKAALSIEELVARAHAGTVGNPNATREEQDAFLKEWRRESDAWARRQEMIRKMVK